MNLGLFEVMRYNAWANLALLDACRELTDQQLDARLPVATRSLFVESFGSLAGTIAAYRTAVADHRPPCVYTLIARRKDGKWVQLWRHAPAAVR